MSIQTALVGEYKPDFIQVSHERKPDTLYVISHGGGVNSVAMAIKLLEHGIPLDYIIIADTGAEMPETLAYLQYFQKMFLDKYRIMLLHVVKSTTRLINRNCRIATMLYHDPQAQGADGAR